MPLSAGDRLGPYEVIAQIGAGGMGVVYRARDSRVGRDVAIKVSSEHFSDRFESEARAVAALNHANVCTLHDVGPNYLVMELVEGLTLAEVITRREGRHAGAAPGLPFEEALGYARQIADALDAAHQRGIVHRDLKPGNIKVRDDGTVKVLDFGLAKIGPSQGSLDDPDNSPTMAPGATQAGTILGTAAYMAPEQARGKPVDKRADIWAFGAVVYEMLAGRRAFDGDDVSTIMASVIRSEPRWDDVPASVRRLLKSCLEKDPRRRLRDIGDVWKLLDDEKPVAASPSRTGTLGWAAAAVLAVAVLIALWAPWRQMPRDAAQPLVRLDVDLGPDVSLAPLVSPTFSTVILSPDGTRLVLAGSMSGGSQRLFSRRLDESRVVEIQGTEGALNPFFSPDGQWVAFWTSGKLFKVPVEGGAVVLLAQLDVMTGGSWKDADALVVANGAPNPMGLVRVPAAGGAPVAISTLAGGELFFNFPQVLPGGKAVLTGVVGTPPGIDTTNVEIVLLDGGERKVLVRGGTSPRYLPSGHIVYVSRAGMFALPFDLDTMETRGAAVPILSDMAADPITRGGQFDVSDRGTFVYRSALGGGAPPPTDVQWIGRDGKREALLDKSGGYAGDPRVSPDGGRVVLSVRDGAKQDIWVYDAPRAAMTRLTSGEVAYVNPVWSRDGRYVIFGSMGRGMFWTRADGGGQPRPLLAVGSSGLQFPNSIAPDGQRLVFEQVDGRPQLWTVELRQDDSGVAAGTPVPFLKSAFTEQDGRVSPDGQWVAYASNESGKVELYVRPFSEAATGTQGKVQLSNNGGGYPRWSPNGRDLVYLSGDQIMAVSYRASSGTFLADKPRVWASGVSGAVGIDFSPDGERVLINFPGARDERRQDHAVVILQNFFDELRRRAPPGQNR